MPPLLSASVAGDAVPTHPFAIVVDATSHVTVLVAVTTRCHDAPVLVNEFTESLASLVVPERGLIGWQLLGVWWTRKRSAVGTPQAAVVLDGAGFGAPPTHNRRRL